MFVRSGGVGGSAEGGRRACGGFSMCMGVRYAGIIYVFGGYTHFRQVVSIVVSPMRPAIKSRVCRPPSPVRRARGGSSMCRGVVRWGSFYFWRLHAFPAGGVYCRIPCASNNKFTSVSSPIPQAARTRRVLDVQGVGTLRFIFIFGGSAMRGGRSFFSPPPPPSRNSSYWSAHAAGPRGAGRRRRKRPRRRRLSRSWGCEWCGRRCVLVECTEGTMQKL